MVMARIKKNKFHSSSGYVSKRIRMREREGKFDLSIRFSSKINSRKIFDSQNWKLLWKDRKDEWWTMSFSAGFLAYPHSERSYCTRSLPEGRSSLHRQSAIRILLQGWVQGYYFIHQSTWARRRFLALSCRNELSIAPCYLTETPGST